MKAEAQRDATGKAAWMLATWWGCGFSPIAPGTVGSVAALPLYFAVRDFGPVAILVLALLMTAIGIWASERVAEDTGIEDPQIVVVDEVAGVLFALAAAPRTIAGVVAAVFFFRLFDITKPFPARAAERLPRGWGIVLDDVVAGGWAALGVAALRVAGFLE